MSKLITLLVVIMSIIISTSNSPFSAPPTKALNKFITEHAQNASVYMMQNGEVLLNYRSDFSMPVSSTTKIMIAAAYADQIAKEQISIHEEIDLAAIQKFYFPIEQNKKFETWILNNKTKRLGEVIRMMIKLDSDAIEEYLIGKLSLEKISRIIGSFEINDHDKILPPVSMQLAMRTEKKQGDVEISHIINSALSIHEDLINGNRSVSNYKSLVEINEAIFNEFRPNATTKIYTELLDNVLGYNKMDDNVIDVLLPFLLDVSFDENGNETYLNQPYMLQSKTTSDSYNVIIYNKKPNSDERFVTSYFFNNLSNKDLSKLQKFLEDIVDDVHEGGSIEDVISILQKLAFD